MQTPPYGFFLMNRIKALPKEKSKELSFIPQAIIFRQTTGRSKEDPGAGVCAASFARGVWSAGFLSFFS